MIENKDTFMDYFKGNNNALANIKVTKKKDDKDNDYQMDIFAIDKLLDSRNKMSAFGRYRVKIDQNKFHKLLNIAFKFTERITK